ncbi:hypothetical protein [Bacillus safensis]|uniref:hypothetical protein n=1 Tax=Bacillus safensis TaxID=561879 RepID=UPI001CF087DF|nr:hypothetical protein [Bacillus safensis]MCA6607461.1 hypothetical protein [Bacillus safensis]
MTEEKRTIHVLKDENLGIDREYVAVDRNAEVGEKIVVTKSEYVEGEIYEIGHYGKVNITEEDGGVNADFNGFDNSFVDDDGRWFVGDEDCSAYHVLEPTDIVHIDGERYRLEDRKAEVGEKIIVTKSYDIPLGHISTVEKLDVIYDDGSCYLEDELGREDYFDGESDRYLVLTPVQDAAEAQESDVITVLANLGAEVAELKRKNEQFEQALGWNEMGPGYIPELRNGLSELKSVVSNYESELGRMQAEINALHEDKVRLGEQLAKVAAGDPKALSLTASDLAQVYVSLKKAGL